MFSVLPDGDTVEETEQSGAAGAYESDADGGDESDADGGDESDADSDDELDADDLPEPGEF